MAVKRSSACEPMVPPNCDLRGFPRMMVDIPRLFGSGFNLSATSNPTAWMCGFKLWMKSFHQVPAASLPDDDVRLCQLAELGFDLKTWRKAKPLAMHNWHLCTDGLLYHPVVAEVALEAWLDQLGYRLRSLKANAKQHGITRDIEPLCLEISISARKLQTLNNDSKWLAKPHVQEALRGFPEPPQRPPTGSQEGGDEGVLEGSQQNLSQQEDPSQERAVPLASDSTTVTSASEHAPRLTLVVGG